MAARSNLDKCVLLSKFLCGVWKLKLHNTFTAWYGGASAITCI